MMKGISRRTFMKRSVAVGAAAIATRPFARVLGANDDIRVAVVGFKGRGRGHIKNFNKSGRGCRVVALCDIDEKILNKEVGNLKQRGQAGR
jgi:NADH/NAD ratio-sensing transcriptional regulator Rex